jgi:CBS domain-containing protein
MPSYRQVAQQKVDALLDPNDLPETVGEEDGLREVAEAIAKSPARTVVVVNGEGRVSGVISATDIADAIGEGMASDTPASRLTARKPPVQTVASSALLEEIPSLVGPFSTVVVTDHENRPKAVLNREVLGARVQSRFGAPS